ncbi:hypothetical protein [Chryseobacterium sp. JM1]|uniref:hypothetical protein n=1 Tax=Chryseobacterium sp. JM1 TaxID=1233950 RepID=UPI0004E70B29|nr:hypothetical protein [Chryseobacterium sp. JM1]KFF20523.1 hypothetical protein IW22_12830 [Chryseobacterium sp. JM1]
MKGYIFLVLLLMISCKKSEINLNTSVIDEELDLRYEVLNQLIDNERMSTEEKNDIFIVPLKSVYLFEKREDESLPLSVILKYDSVFLMRDSAYYKNQAKTTFNFKLDKTKIKRPLQYATEEGLDKLTENGKKDFWVAFRTKFGNKCFRKLSVPFFNKEKTMCIVENSISCGYLSGSGYTAIYKKINGKWVEIKIVEQWIS